MIFAENRSVSKAQLRSFLEEFFVSHIFSRFCPIRTSHTRLSPRRAARLPDVVCRHGFADGGRCWRRREVPRSPRLPIVVCGCATTFVLGCSGGGDGGARPAALVGGLGAAAAARLAASASASTLPPRPLAARTPVPGGLSAMSVSASASTSAGQRGRGIGVSAVLSFEERNRGVGWGGARTDAEFFDFPLF